MLCATSSSAYKNFGELFDRFIPEAPNQKEFTSGGFHNIEISNEDLTKVKRIQISVCRNVDNYPLVSGMSKD